MFKTRSTDIDGMFYFRIYLFNFSYTGKIEGVALLGINHVYIDETLFLYYQCHENGVTL